MKVDPRYFFSCPREKVEPRDLAHLADPIPGLQVPVDVGVLEREDAQEKRGAPRNRAIRQPSANRSPPGAALPGASSRAMARVFGNGFSDDFRACLRRAFSVDIRTPRQTYTLSGRALPAGADGSPGAFERSSTLGSSVSFSIQSSVLSSPIRLCSTHYGGDNRHGSTRGKTLWSCDRGIPRALLSDHDRIRDAKAAQTRLSARRYP